MFFDSCTPTCFRFWYPAAASYLPFINKMFNSLKLAIAMHIKNAHERVLQMVSPQFDFYELAWESSFVQTALLFRRSRFFAFMIRFFFFFFLNIEPKLK